MDNSFIKKFLKGLASASFGTAATVAFHFFSIMVMVRYTTVDDFGLYMLLLAVVHGLRVFSGLGLDLTLVKFTSATENAAARQHTFATIFVTRLVVALAIGALTVLLGQLILPAFDARLLEVLFYLPVLCVLTSIKEMIFYYFQGLYLFKKYAIASVASAAFKFGLIFLFLSHTSLGIVQLIEIELIGLVGCLALQIVMLPAGTFKRLLPSAAALKKSLLFGVPLYLNNLLTFFYERSSVFIIGYLLDPISIALYEIAAKIPDGFQRLFSSFIAVYFPSLSGLLSEGKSQAAERIMNKSLILLSAAVMFLTLVAFLFKDQIIVLLFSEKYLEASLAFTVLMVNFQIIIVSYTLGYSLVSAGFAALPVKVNSVATVINVIANFALIPIYGFIGAVYASLVMNVSALVLNYFYLRRYGMLPAMLRYFSPLAVAVALMLIFQIAGLQSLVARLAFLSLYSLLCFAFEKELRGLFQLGARLPRFSIHREISS